MARTAIVELGGTKRDGFREVTLDVASGTGGGGEPPRDHGRAIFSFPDDPGRPFRVRFVAGSESRVYAILKLLAAGATDLSGAKARCDPKDPSRVYVLLDEDNGQWVEVGLGGETSLESPGFLFGSLGAGFWLHGRLVAGTDLPSDVTDATAPR